MSLRLKILLVLVAVLTGYLGFTYSTLRALVIPSFSELEGRIADANVVRARHSIDTVVKFIDLTTRDWAEWDDTYAFVQNENDAFLSNLTEYSYTSLDVDLILFCDARGRVIWGGGFDVAANEKFALDEVFENPLASGHRLLSHRKSGDGVGGLLQTRRGPMAIVSRPVLSSEAKGPIAGTVIFGRILNAERLAAMSRQTGVEFALLPALRAGLGPGDHKAFERLARFGEATLHEKTEQILLSYSIFEDIYGRPSFLIRVQTPQEIASLGLNAVQLAILLVVIGGFVFMASLWVLLRRLIIRPMSDLTGHILGIRTSGDLTKRIGAERSDEIGTLASQFDGLAGELETAREAMAESRDQALQAARTKSEFLATMSHEIRTPMNGVIGMAELLLCTRLDPKQKQFAETIQNSADGLLTIINDILDFSKLEAGKVEIDNRDFDLRSLVEDAAMLFAGTAQAKGIELICCVPPEVDFFCRGDPNRLRQVLMNLIGNAVKFTKRGEVVVEVAAEGEVGGEHRIRFEVRDTGIGLTSEASARIFESFIQADASTTRDYGGTGLGLAISSQLVGLMGGEIRVESEPERGSRFWFEVVLGCSEVSARARHRAAPALRGASALVVDDNATNRQILHRQLAAWRMSCVAVADGPAALEALRQADSRGRRFDIVLLDMHMPGMDGIELARTIQSDPALASVPLVMLSSALLAGPSDEHEDAGLLAYLVKPVRQSELFDTLVGMLSGVSVHAGGEVPDATRAAERLGGRVLLVEDNPVNQEVARAMLEYLGCEVSACANGQEALAALERARYDAVLMDCQMPIMDGFEATAEIRRRESAGGSGPRVPIIALTANAVEGDRERCLAADMDDYLSKPFRRSQLCGLLQRWLPARTRAPKGSGDAADRADASDPQAQYAPAVDPAALDAIRELASAKRPQLLADVVGAYWESSKALIQELESAVEETDAEALRQAAHALKSGSRNVGAHLLAEMCEELEMMGRAQQLDSAKDRFKRVCSEHRRVLEALEEAVPFKSA